MGMGVYEFAAIPPAKYFVIIVLRYILLILAPRRMRNGKIMRASRLREPQALC
jgi:hypothetical protein